MSRELTSDEKQPVKRVKPVDKAADKERPAGLNPTAAHILHLQRQVGNRAVQRMLIQREGDGSFELDDETATQIDGARGSGQALDSTVQEQMSATMGHDFSGVQVHTSPESDQLNQQLSAKAFTTGQDIFFKQGAYDPGSSSGKELIAHELTHVVQQSAGRVGGGSGMTVRPPGDAFEQEADAVAKQAVQASSEMTGQTDVAGVQREEMPEEEELIQQKALQRQEMPEEEELIQQKAVQRQEMPEEEEMIQQKAVQREEMPEEEELIQQKAVQREEMPEEDEVV